MTNASDRELLEGFRAGDGRALDALFERYEGPVFQFLVGLLRDHHLAEDVLQETFVRALERLEGVDPDHLRGWLFTVAYHQAMLSRRKQRGRGGLPRVVAVEFAFEDDRLPDPTSGPEAEAERREHAERIRVLLEQLPPQQREVIRQRVYEGKRFREIAADLECPLNTALARMHEGLKRLRLLWEENHA
jgi:RNA polymerase sigma-70 factor (ECF subfamily)